MQPVSYDGRDMQRSFWLHNKGDTAEITGRDFPKQSKNNKDREFYLRSGIVFFEMVEI